MKIREITLKNFGKYKNVESPLVFKEGVNVVYGLNEAGKSTMFNGLLTLLYGYKPANREAHPYLGWGETKMEVAGVFEDAEGVFQIERKLMSSVTGKLLRGDDEQKINNKPLDILQSISRPTYESIYALTLHDVVQMGEKPWSEVEDRLILNYGMTSVLSPREVLQLLDADMKRIFNPRGQARNARVKVLESEIKGLKKERVAILENQERVTEKEEALHQLNEALDGILKEEATIRKDIQWWEKHEKVIELTRGLEAISKERKNLQDQVGQIPEGARNIKVLGKEAEEKQSRLQALKQEQNQIDRALKPLTNLENICLGSEEKIRSLVKRYRKHQSNRELQASKRQHVKDKHTQLLRQVSDIMAEPSDIQIKALSGLNILSIEGKLETIERMKSEIEKLKEEIYVRQAMPEQSPKGKAMVLLVVGCLIFAGGLYLNQDLMKYAAVLLISYGGFQMMNTNKDEALEDIGVFQDKIDFNQKQVKEAVNALVRELTQLEIGSETVEHSGLRLIEVLKQAKVLAQEYSALNLEFDGLMEQLNIEDQSLHLEFKNLNLVEDGSPMDEQIIERTIASAIEKRHGNVKVKTRSDELGNRIKEVELAYATLIESYEHLKAYCLNIGDHDVDRGLEKLKQLDKIIERENLMVEQLDEKDPGRTMRHDIDHLSDAELDMSSKKIELRELTDQISEMKVTKKGLETEIGHLLEGVDLFDVESQLSALEEELEEAKIAYDKLLTLRTVVAAYDQSYREEHQPDIHKRTGYYFESITNNKYGKVYNDELVGKTALVVRQGDDERDAENALSQGTRDQLYLALRLALADELDRDKTTMPLFLDELFVNWDMPRLEAGLSLIRQIADQRQVVIFTCHEWMVDKLERCCKAHTITLEG